MDRRYYRLRYYGADTEDHTLDAEQLGKALVAFSALEKTLHGDKKTKEGNTVEVRVKAVREGSVVVDIASALRGIDLGPDLFSKENLGLFFSSTGLTITGFITWIVRKAASQKDVEGLDSTGPTTTNNASGAYATINQNAGDVNIHHHHYHALQGDDYARFLTVKNLDHVKDLTAPALKSEDAGLCLDDGEGGVEVNHEDAINIHKFTLPAERETVEYFDDTVSVETASFKDDEKFRWTLESSNLGCEIKAIIEDPELQAKIQEYVLHNTRILNVRIKQVSYRPYPGAKIKTQYYVTRVDGPPQQLPFS